MLGDFYAQTVELLPSHQHIIGPRSVQPQVASGNGMPLLDLASAQRLVLGKYMAYISTRTRWHPWAVSTEQRRSGAHLRVLHA